MFIAPSVDVTLPEGGRYSLRLSPELTAPGSHTIIMVSPVDVQQDIDKHRMQWHRVEDIMGRHFYCGAYIDIRDDGLRVAMSAIRPVDDAAKSFYFLEGDYIRFLWTGRAKAAVQAAIDADLVPQLKTLMDTMADSFTGGEMNV